MSDYNPATIYNPIIWDDLPGVISGSTPYGYFDDDSTFQADGPKFARWCARGLGYPMIDIEIDSGSLYRAFEDAVLEYSAQVNQFTIRENMINLIGTPNDKNDSRYIDYATTPNPTSLQRIFKISEEYGKEADVSGDVKWYKFGIPLTASVQEYDLNALIVSQSGGREIEIRRVYHNEPVAFGYGMSGLYNSNGYGNSNYSILGEFGWEGIMYGGGAGGGGGAGTGLSYTMTPIFEDLLRMQSVELNNQIRRLGYGFEIHNNIIRLFPIPVSEGTVWVDYIVKDDKISGTPTTLFGTSSLSRTSNLGDAPYSYLEYAKINGPGKRWIFKYAFAVAKSIVGEIRSKYQTIPIPGSEISLNGDSMKQEAQTEKDQLLEQLRTDLERTGTQVQMQIQAENSENMQKLLSKIPMMIYIG